MDSIRSKKIVTAAVLIAAAVMVVVILSAVLRAKAPELTLRDADTGEKIADVALGDSGEFSVTFRHSVNKTDVTETYVVRDGKVFLTGCVYYSFGAGVAEELPDGWVLSYGDNGEMILSGIEQEMPGLIYYVGTVYDHVLAAGGETYSLTELCGRNRKVLFEAG